jgi:cohesin complex subunit SA-1/2
VFDQEPRVRRAVGDFVKGLLAEKVEELESTWSAVKGTKKKRGSKITEKDMRTYLGWKALASMLVTTYRDLDSREAGTSTAPSVPVSVSMGRATAAVEALRGSIEGLSDWHELVDYLLLDHSTGDQDMWLLGDEEEDFMIQVLIACIKADAAEDVSPLSSRQVEADVQEENKDEQTKALVKVYPRLLSKHQADVGRMSALLMIPSQMNLGLYLDMRMTNVSCQIFFFREFS